MKLNDEQSEIANEILGDIHTELADAQNIDVDVIDVEELEESDLAELESMNSDLMNVLARIRDFRDSHN